MLDRESEAHRRPLKPSGPRRHDTPGPLVPRGRRIPGCLILFVPDLTEGFFGAFLEQPPRGRSSSKSGFRLSGGPWVVGPACAPEESRPRGKVIWLRPKEALMKSFVAILARCALLPCCNFGRRGLRTCRWRPSGRHRSSAAMLQLWPSRSAAMLQLWSPRTADMSMAAIGD